MFYKTTNPRTVGVQHSRHKSEMKMKQKINIL